MSDIVTFDKIMKKMGLYYMDQKPIGDETIFYKIGLAYKDLVNKEKLERDDFEILFNFCLDYSILYGMKPLAFKTCVNMNTLQGGSKNGKSEA